MLDASSLPNAGVTDDRCAQHSGAVNQPCLTLQQGGSTS